MLLTQLDIYYHERLKRGKSLWFATDKQSGIPGYALSIFWNSSYGISTNKSVSASSSAANCLLVPLIFALWFSFRKWSSFESWKTPLSRYISSWLNNFPGSQSIRNEGITIIHRIFSPSTFVPTVVFLTDQTNQLSFGLRRRELLGIAVLASVALFLLNVAVTARQMKHIERPNIFTQASVSTKATAVKRFNFKSMLVFAGLIIHFTAHIRYSQMFLSWIEMGPTLFKVSQNLCVLPETWMLHPEMTSRIMRMKTSSSRIISSTMSPAKSSSFALLQIKTEGNTLSTSPPLLISDFYYTLNWLDSDSPSSIRFFYVAAHLYHSSSPW